MKRALVFFLFSVFCFQFSVRPVLAQGFELLPAGQTIDSDYIRVGNAVQIDGEIKGDAFLIGGLVTVNGKVDGDLFILAGKANINGEVGSSVRVMAGDATINAPVGRNIALVCGNCSVTRQSTIAGSLLAAAGNFEVSAAKIGRGFRFFGSRLFLNSEIGSESFVVADREFLLGPKASISGHLKYTGSKEVILETGATVAGTISYQKQKIEESYPRFFGARTILESYKKVKPLTDLFSFAVSALVGFILLGLFPRGFEKVTMAIENKPYASLGWGIVAALAIPVIIVLFTLTVVGIPVALVLAVLFYLLWLAAQYLTAFFLGRKILLSRFGERRGWAIVLGLFLIYLLGLLPVLGNLTKLILVLFALGALVLSYKQPVIIEQRPLPFETFPITRSRSRSRPRKTT